MTQLEQVAFNLIINSACSFVAGLLIVTAILALFKVGNSRWKLALLSLPFVKILWDISRGIPSSSIIFSGLNPLNLPPQHQTLALSAGFTQAGPLLNLSFAARDTHGVIHSTSFADYVAAYLMKHGHENVPTLILGVIAFVAAVFLARRAYLGARFEFERRRQRHEDQPLRVVQLRLRKIDLYTSRAYSGTPFTGGLIKPYICIPESTLLKLSEAEREAVIAHEIAHVRHWDLLATLAVKILGDIFWFIPFYRSLSRRIDRLREILADQAAVARGASRIHLASALVRLKEAPLSAHQPILYSAFFREPALLKERVSSLLDGVRTGGRLGWKWVAVRALILVWTAGAVMVATFGGNHELQGAVSVVAE